MKNTIVLTETQLHKAIKECVKRVISEGKAERAAIARIKHGGSNVVSTSPISKSSIWKDGESMSSQLRDEKQKIREKLKRIEDREREKKNELVNRKINALLARLDDEGHHFTDSEKQLITDKIKDKYVTDLIRCKTTWFLPNFLYKVLRELGLY